MLRNNIKLKILIHPTGLHSPKAVQRTGSPSYRIFLDLAPIEALARSARFKIFGRDEDKIIIIQIKTCCFTAKFKYSSVLGTHFYCASFLWTPGDTKLHPGIPW